MAKTFTGVVVSDRADKTIVVTVRTRKTHPIYKKQYTVSKKFMAHDEENRAKSGDKVIIVETRPISARKRFALEQVVERATIQHEETFELPQSESTVTKSASNTKKTDKVSEKPAKGEQT